MRLGGDVHEESVLEWEVRNRDRCLQLGIGRSKVLEKGDLSLWTSDYYASHIENVDCMLRP
jgi:hypothetical protein